MSFLLKCDFSFVKNSIYNILILFFWMSHLFCILHSLNGLQRIFKWTLHAKMAMPDLQLYPWNNLIKNVEDSAFFCLEKFLFPWVSQFLFKKQETTIINKQFKGTKKLIFHSYLIRQSFQGYRRKMGHLKVRSQSL